MKEIISNFSHCSEIQPADTFKTNEIDIGYLVILLEFQWEYKYVP